MEAAINECKTDQENWGTPALEQRRARSCRQLAAIAARRESWIRRNRYYYQSLRRLLRFLIEPQKKVLSVRCGTGFHLTAVSPKRGKGIDLCTEIVEIARQQNPSFEFAVAFPDKNEFREQFKSGEKFDYILFSNIGDTVDALQALRNLRPLCLRHTRLLVETYNRLWEPAVTFAERLGIKVPDDGAELALNRRHPKPNEACRIRSPSDASHCDLAKICAGCVGFLKSVLRTIAVTETALHDAGRRRQATATACSQRRTVRLRHCSL